jgi:hypothetical protein
MSPSTPVAQGPTTRRPKTHRTQPAAGCVASTAAMASTGPSARPSFAIVGDPSSNSSMAETSPFAARGGDPVSRLVARSLIHEGDDTAPPQADRLVRSLMARRRQSVMDGASWMERHGWSVMDGASWMERHGRSLEGSVRRCKGPTCELPVPRVQSEFRVLNFESGSSPEFRVSRSFRLLRPAMRCIFQRPPCLEPLAHASSRLPVVRPCGCNPQPAHRIGQPRADGKLHELRVAADPPD